MKGYIGSMPKAHFSSFPAAPNVTFSKSGGLIYLEVWLSFCLSRRNAVASWTCVLLYNVTAIDQPESRTARTPTYHRGHSVLSVGIYRYFGTADFLFSYVIARLLVSDAGMRTTVCIRI